MSSPSYHSLAPAPAHPLQRKLAILADAAKYDVSCASSGVDGVHPEAKGKAGLGTPYSSGLCHSFTPDGRCVALLKILLTNFCIYDCLYCINRSSSNVPRARFSVAEVVELTLDFYRRNLIEGLFLSSGIIQNPDYTMSQLAGVARTLRVEHGFRGYIHLKTIPDADPELLALAGRYADRLSINIELPTPDGLAQLAPQKSLPSIEAAMRHTHQRIEEAQQARLEYKKSGPRLLPGAGSKPVAPPRFASAGQSTQMIVGADATNDAAILATSSRLYRHYGLRRVYYSAFSPIPHAAPALAATAPPLVREHRLYQADWLLRFYGFSQEEIVDGRPDGMLDLDFDPKLAWALTHRQWFPVDLQSAPREMLLRVPGLGVRSVNRLLSARRVRTLRLADLATLRLPLNKLRPFIMLSDHHPGPLLDSPHLADQLRQPSPLLAHQQQADALAAAAQPGSARATGRRHVRRSAAVSGGPQQLDLFAEPPTVAEVVAVASAAEVAEVPVAALPTGRAPVLLTAA